MAIGTTGRLGSERANTPSFSSGTESSSPLGVIGARRRRRRAVERRWLVIGRVAVIVGAIAAMALLNATKGDLTMPHPMDVWDQSWEMWSDGTMLTALGQSLRVLSTGFLLAAASGILFGIVFGAFHMLGRVVDPFVHALNSTPGAAFIPLVIVWFGLYYEAKIFVVWLSAFFPILITTTSGIGNTDDDLTEMARALGATRRTLFWQVMVPGAVPAILSGLRIGAAVATVGTVVSELYMAQSGLGGLLSAAGNRFQMDRYFAVVIVLMIVGTLVTTALRALENTASKWRSARRDVS